MKKDGKTIIFDNLLDWAPASAFKETGDAEKGKWVVDRGVHGSRSGLVLWAGGDPSLPELRFDPGLSGWHDVRRMMAASGFGDRKLYVRIAPQPWFILREGCDVDAWLCEGLVDALVAAHYLIGSPGHPSRFDLSPIKSLIQGRSRLVAQVMRSCDLHTALALAQQVYDQGADGTAVYESEIAISYPSLRDAFHKLRSADVRPLEI